MDHAKGIMTDTANQMKRQEYRVAGLSEPISHYTDAVRFGDMVYISGVAPLDADGELVGRGDPAMQARKIMENTRLILDACGATFANILRVTVYLTNIEDRKEINPVREEFFGRSLPASTLVEVSKLAIPGMLVEIEAIVGLSSTREGATYG
jgi:2-iminobutanoate/2-iminopropanoate deaminase